MTCLHVSNLGSSVGDWVGLWRGVVRLDAGGLVVAFLLGVGALLLGAGGVDDATADLVTAGPWVSGGANASGVRGVPRAEPRAETANRPPTASEAVAIWCRRTQLRLVG